MNKKLLTYLVPLTLVALGVVSAGLREEYVNTQSVIGVSTEISWENARAIIVPHHALASDLIASAYNNFPKDKYEYVVVLGPNHFHPESETITMADNIDGTNVDGRFTQSMANALGNAVVNNEMLKGDHSIMLQLPYVREHFPSAKVVTLLIAPHSNSEDVDNAVDYLYRNLSVNTLYIGSVDFSHETLQLEALARNDESIEAIKNFDYQKLASFTDLNMDSPLSIIMLSKLAKLYDATTWQTLFSSHASLIENSNSIKGTSYVVGAFY